MDIGKLKNNNKYYEGYEGEVEIRISLEEKPEYCIHIWDGYFENIFGETIPGDGPWFGFTRDYQECVGAFGSGQGRIEDIDEYLRDLRQYEDMKFSYEETGSCLKLLKDFLQYAKANNEAVLVENI